MTEKAEVKPEPLPDLDDLLQCPVCYEIPSGQIFQCNEGHHVCGRCKMRLDVCPVCRALFFGTRNYAMEELISNIRKLRAFKLGGKITTASSESTTSAEDGITGENEDDTNTVEENDIHSSDRSTLRPPPACKGLFRCLCCKNGNCERLPAARLLNHLRYFHSPELIEGQSDNGEYLQAWQFSTVYGRITTAIRVSDMGIFFMIIEITNNSVCAWLTMAAAPWVAHEFSYTVTISGNDREAIFSDSVWSVKSCEGTLKKRGHCLIVNGLDARALIAPTAINCKLSIRRTPVDQLAHQTQPRAVLRVANRGNSRDNVNASAGQDLGPFLQDLQNNVARLSRAFASLGREANALVQSEAELRTRIDNEPRTNQNANPNEPATASAQAEPQPTAPNNQPETTERAHLSRSARRRMRQRLRAALNATQAPAEPALPTPRSSGHSTVSQRQNFQVTNNSGQRHTVDIILQPPSSVSAHNNIPNNTGQQRSVDIVIVPQLPISTGTPLANGQLTASTQRQTNRNSNSATPLHVVDVTIVEPSPSGSSNEQTQNQNRARKNKKKRRQRR